MTTQRTLPRSRARLGVTLAVVLTALGTAPAALAAPTVAPPTVQNTITQNTTVLNATAQSIAVQTAAVTYASVLTAPTTLRPGDTVQSPSGRYSLFLTGGSQQPPTVFSERGLLVQEKGNRFASDQAGNGGVAPALLAPRSQSDEWLDRVEFRPDGNLVAVGVDGNILAQSGSAGRGGARLVLQDDGNVVILTAAGAVVWSSGSHAPTALGLSGSLLPGERMVSADGGTTLVMQADGNLVLYRGNQVRFSSNTSVPGSAAVVQRDGNLVVLSPDLRPLWNLGSTPVVDPLSRPLQTLYPDRLELSDGDFRVISSRAPGSEEVVSFGGSAWSRPTLEPGEVMDLNDRRRAPNGVELVLQLDRNLVQYVRGVAVFDIVSRGASAAGDRAIMQRDGNFVVYDQTTSGLVPQWETRTGGNPGSRFVLQSDGNGVIYTPAGQAVFATRR